MAKTKKKAIKKKRKKTKKSIKRKKKLKIGTTRKLSKSSKKAKSKSKKRKTNGGKMSAEMKLSSVLDTSHLKVKFPFKAKYGNYINGKFVEPKSGSILTILLRFQMKKSVQLQDQMKKTWMQH